MSRMAKNFLNWALFELENNYIFFKKNMVHSC